MRRILVDEARRRHSLKRRAPGPVESAPDAVAVPEAPVVDMLALDEALSDLEKEHPRAARVVMLRYFAGLSLQEIGAALETTVRTVSRDWEFARSWLHCALDEDT